MNRHLVTVKVGVKRRTDQRMQLNCLALNQGGFKRLNTQTVQRRRPVQHHRMFANHLVEDIPYFGAFFLDQFFGLFNRGRQALSLKARINKWLE